MSPPADDGGSPAPVDRPILPFLRDPLATTDQVRSATITDDGHVELHVTFADAYYPDRVRGATLGIGWYTNDDFAIHYREVHGDGEWECRWDRHPNPHNTRDHFHPPPDASTPGEDASWPSDYRDVTSEVLTGSRNGSPTSGGRDPTTPEPVGVLRRYPPSIPPDRPNPDPPVSGPHK